MNLRIPKITKGQIAAILAGMMVVAGTFWLRSNNQQKKTLETPFHAPEQANYYARDIQVSVMNKEGQPFYILHADQMKQFPDDSARMKQVHLRYLGNRSTVRERGNWRLRADHGYRPPHEKKRIRFHGNVVVNGATAKGKPLTLHTSTLTVMTESKQLKTRAPVRLDSGPSTLTAVGMHGNMNTEKLYFMKDVHATLVPDHPPSG